jgi:hypothetical protein
LSAIHSRNAGREPDHAVAVRRRDRTCASGRRLERADLRSRGAHRRQRSAGMGVLHLPSQRDVHPRGPCHRP